MELVEERVVRFFTKNVIVPDNSSLLDTSYVFLQFLKNL